MVSAARSGSEPGGPGRRRLPDVLGIATILRQESVGGALLVMSAAAALVLANSPASGVYGSIRDTAVGPSALGLRLSLQDWAAEGLLAVFFFVAGLEVKREFAAGDLRDARRAAVPVAAAIGGMLLPAVLYVAINLTDASALAGWAIPTATDIAFALAVLAVIGRRLPTAVRTFLLTLAVVDDLLAIAVIAIFYSHHLRVPYLLAAALPLALFALIVRRGLRRWWVLVPAAASCWWFMHASGVHATVAGVLLALTVPVTAGVGSAGTARPAGPTIADRLDHVLRPLSAGVAVPIFAFLSAGVGIGGLSGLGTAVQSRVVIGIVVGMVVGKAVGIFGSAIVTSRLLRSPLSAGLSRADLAGVAILGGVGFTVSLLIGEIAFGAEERQQQVRIAVLVASLTASLLAGIVMGIRNRSYRVSGRADAGDGHDDRTSGAPR